MHKYYLYILVRDSFSINSNDKRKGETLNEIFKENE